MMTSTRAQLPYAKQSAPSLTLEHGIAMTGSVQRRLANRIVLIPAVDLVAFRFRAVIDWVEFRLHLGRSTQAQHIQAVLRRFLDRDSHIVAEDEGPGGVFSVCTIKIQEPASLALISAIHKALVGAFGEAAGSRVIGMEVSLDASPREASDATRAVLLGALQRTIWTGRDIWSNRNSRPRTAFGRTSKETFTLTSAPEKDSTALCRSVPENHRTPVIDGTMYLGARDDDVMIRAMDKVKDSQRPDGSFIELKEDQKRVRIEVTLKGVELPAIGITDIASLDQLNLEKFQKRYFQFKLPTFSRRHKSTTAADVLHNTQQEWRAQTYLRSGITGLMAMDAATARNRKAMKTGVQKMLRRRGMLTGRSWVGKRLAPPVVSWAAMNRKVNVALRDLMKREITARVKGEGR